MGSRKLFAFMGFLGVEEVCFLIVEGNAPRGSWLSPKN